MTPEEAIRQLRDVRTVAPAETAEALRTLAEHAVDRLADASPVDSGALRDSWRAVDGAVVNDRDRASYAADGWAEREAPRVLDDLERDTITDIEQRLGAHFRS